MASFTSFSHSSINNPPAPRPPLLLKHAVSCNRFAEGAIFSSAGCPPPRDFKEAGYKNCCKVACFFPPLFCFTLGWRLIATLPGANFKTLQLPSLRTIQRRRPPAILMLGRGRISYYAVARGDSFRGGFRAEGHSGIFLLLPPSHFALCPDLGGGRIS